MIPKRKSGTLPSCILLANDDGFDATGIQALAQVFSEKHDPWKLCLVAPDRERSGTSQAMHFHSPVILEELAAERFRLIDGYPADCVNVALSYAGFDSFYLVISGINHGPNLGDDIHYSGTVAIARHSAIHGICSVAMSSVNTLASMEEYQRMARWLKTWVIENYRQLKSEIFYNINYPHEKLSHKERLNTPYPQILYTSQGRRVYKDVYQNIGTQELGSRKQHTLQILSDTRSYVKSPADDFNAIERHAISVTPLSICSTHQEELEKFKGKEA